MDRVPQDGRDGASAGAPAGTPESPALSSGDAAAPRGPSTPQCDVCGSDHTAWIKCKLVCLACHSIVMSCGDL